MLNLYLSDLEGDLYNDAITSSLSESAGCLIGGLLMIKLNVKLTMLISNLLPALGAFGLLFTESYFFIAMINLGNGASYVLMATMVIRVVHGAGNQTQAYSACSFTAIVVSALSPFVCGLM